MPCQFPEATPLGTVGLCLQISAKESWGLAACARAASPRRSQAEMGRKGSARGPSAERCFLVGPFRSAASADAPLYREAFSSSLVQMDVGLSALQLRFLVTSCLAGVCVTALAAGWRVFARLSNILTF